ncbi:centromere protein H isoform X1 [Petromyzon marinus]|uniref:centromere protein H isoform X1 n=1 Tax=Petromyzon marinus TaxID=7757 RepID=UPI003F6E63F4
MWRGPRGAPWGPRGGTHGRREGERTGGPRGSTLDGDAARALQDVSDRLARVALGCPLGTHDETGTLGEEEGALLRAVSFCEELQHQSQELHAVGAAYIKDKEQDISPNALHREILDLHKTLEKSSEFTSNRELVINNLLTNRALIQTMMESRSEKSEAILAQLFHKTSLSQQIIAAVEKKNKLLQELLETQREVLAMKEQNQALLKEVKEVIGAQVSHSQQPQTKQQMAGSHKLTIANNRVTILRNALQALIQSSGINWAADPNLLGFVLQMGKDKKF